MEVSFSKYSGCGNDFIIIDNRRICQSFSKEVIRRLCHRSLGIGADGIILLENPVSSKAFYRMRIFNSDGSKAEMCGNGIRCLAHYIHSSEDSGDHFEIETMHHLLKVSFPNLKKPDSELICVAMPPPSAITYKKILINKREIPLYCLDTGVPHAVYFTESIESQDFLSLAPLIRMHPEFQPRGTNVNFVQILSADSIIIRTYERGVENETLACGTGAAASAIASVYAFSLNLETPIPDNKGIQDSKSKDCLSLLPLTAFSRLKTPVKVHVRSNDYLFINFQIKRNFFSELTMAGPAIKIFDGKVLV